MKKILFAIHFSVIVLNIKAPNHLHFQSITFRECILKRIWFCLMIFGRFDEIKRDGGISYINPTTVLKQMCARVYLQCYNCKIQSIYFTLFVLYCIVAVFCPFLNAFDRSICTWPLDVSRDMTGM